jgi:hypothetical protein
MEKLPPPDIREVERLCRLAALHFDEGDEAGLAHDDVHLARGRPHALVEYGSALEAQEVSGDRFGQAAARFGRGPRHARSLSSSARV